MNRFEYQTIIMDAKGVLGGKVKMPEFNETLNRMGADGWELVETTGSNQDFGSTRYIICIFKRQIG